MPENLLGMQISNFRYANMDFFQNTTYSNKISEGKNQYSNMNFWCSLVTPDPIDAYGPRIPVR